MHVSGGNSFIIEFICIDAISKLQKNISLIIFSKCYKVLKLYPEKVKWNKCKIQEESSTHSGITLLSSFLNPAILLQYLIN